MVFDSMSGLSIIIVDAMILFLFLFLVVRPAVTAPEITSWTMFMVPIFSASTKSSGGLTLRLVNTILPRFDESATSECSLEESGGKNLLICTSATLRYDSDESEIPLRIRRNGYITFNPVGSCSNDVCLVSPLPLGSETYTQWVWYGTYWKQVIQYTQPINWTDSSYSFNQKDAETNGATISVTTKNGSVSWTLYLVPTLR